MGAPPKVPLRLGYGSSPNELATTHHAVPAPRKRPTKSRLSRERAADGAWRLENLLRKADLHGHAES
eukprot:6099574-Prymnesium_polylepis.1